MKFEELKLEDQREFLAAFAADPLVRKMEDEFNKYRQRGQYIQAMQMRAKIEDVKARVFDKFVARLDRTAERVNLYDTKMTPAQRETMNTLCVTLFMACDIIDSAVVDMKETIKAVDATMEFILFDDIKQVIEQARAKIQFMNSASDVAQNVIWGDTADNMYEMMQNKARSVIRKRDAAGKHWGDEFAEMKAR